MVDPRRPQIHARGVAPMLEGLGQGIAFRNGRLELPTNFVRIPTAGLPRLEESRSQALAALMGSKKAEVLLRIIDTGGMSDRTLAATLGVSDASASRHAAILRSAGLIETRRTGKSVHHFATAVGYLLAGGEGASEA